MVSLNLLSISFKNCLSLLVVAEALYGWFYQSILFLVWGCLGPSFTYLNTLYVLAGIIPVGSKKVHLFQSQLLLQSSIFVHKNAHSVIFQYVFVVVFKCVFYISITVEKVLIAMIMLRVCPNILKQTNIFVKINSLPI